VLSCGQRPSHGHVSQRTGDVVHHHGAFPCEDSSKAVNGKFDAVLAVKTLRNFAARLFVVNQPARSQVDETQALAS
jgi:hypothetical protein